ncbi:MAG: hypothetical protein A2Y62_19150 [Candidatus Fischerbacteria bacterium RBG_13_37_8]|uniref:Antitoxin n=1 Tax=Candidatus Fischerbacteria bacterium RBG_13_37_8 TaxID=1817863 RepID=A0A1F5VR25_9BACT|nr:MAG: hypothetical protein A2Y62_19150 [Candidatus Fischerbacteria bacterium RBG_13_37_8]
MRTTLDLSEKLVNELLELTGTKNKTKIIERAIEEYVRKLKREKIKQAYGKLKLQVDILKLRESEKHE